MKNIIVKNIAQYDTDFDFDELKSIEVPEESIQKANDYLKSNKLSDGSLIGITDTRTAILGFDHIYKNQKKFIPELDPCLIYFSNAQMFSKNIYKYKKQLLNNATKVGPIKKGDYNQDIGKTMLEFQTFFQFASNYIIMLHASLEAFINKIIPNEYEYETKTGKKQSIDWVLRYATFKTKTLEIIPSVTGKNFPLNYPNKYKLIEELITLRNKIIHFSPKTEYNNGRYKELYRKIIDNDYQSAIYQIKDYINYHQPGLIEECDFNNELYFDIIEK